MLTIFIFGTLIILMSFIIYFIVLQLGFPKKLGGGESEEKYDSDKSLKYVNNNLNEKGSVLTFKTEDGDTYTYEGVSICKLYTLEGSSYSDAITINNIYENLINNNIKEYNIQDCQDPDQIYAQFLNVECKEKEDNNYNTPQCYTPEGYIIKPGESLSYFNTCKENKCEGELGFLSFNFNLSKSIIYSSGLEIESNTKFLTITSIGVSTQNDIKNIDGEENTNVINVIDDNNKKNLYKLDINTGNDIDEGIPFEYTFLDMNYNDYRQKFKIIRYNIENNIFVRNDRGVYGEIIHRLLNMYITLGTDKDNMTIYNKNQKANLVLRPVFGTNLRDRVVWMFMPEINLNKNIISQNSRCNYSKYDPNYCIDILNPDNINKFNNTKTKFPNSPPAGIITAPKYMSGYNEPGYNESNIFKPKQGWGSKGNTQDPDSSEIVSLYTGTFDLQESDLLETTTRSECPNNLPIRNNGIVKKGQIIYNSNYILNGSISSNNSILKNSIFDNSKSYNNLYYIDDDKYIIKIPIINFRRFIEYYEMFYKVSDTKVPHLGQFTNVKADTDFNQNIIKCNVFNNGSFNENIQRFPAYGLQALNTGYINTGNNTVDGVSFKSIDHIEAVETVLNKEIDINNYSNYDYLQYSKYLLYTTNKKEEYKLNDLITDGGVLWKVVDPFDNLITFPYTYFNERLNGSIKKFEIVNAGLNYKKIKKNRINEFKFNVNTNFNLSWPDYTSVIYNLYKKDNIDFIVPDAKFIVIIQDKGITNIELLDSGENFTNIEYTLRGVSSSSPETFKDLDINIEIENTTSLSTYRYEVLTCDTYNTLTGCYGEKVDEVGEGLIIGNATIDSNGSITELNIFSPGYNYKENNVLKIIQLDENERSYNPNNHDLNDLAQIKIIEVSKEDENVTPLSSINKSLVERKDLFKNKGIKCIEDPYINYNKNDTQKISPYISSPQLCFVGDRLTENEIENINDIFKNNKNKTSKEIKLPEESTLIDILGQYIPNSNVENFLSLFNLYKTTKFTSETNLDFLKTLQLEELKYSSIYSNTISSKSNLVIGKFIPYRKVVYFNGENPKSDSIVPGTHSDKDDRKEKPADSGQVNYYNSNYTSFIPYGIKDLKKLVSF